MIALISRDYNESDGDKNEKMRSKYIQKRFSKFEQGVILRRTTYTHSNR